MDLVEKWKRERERKAFIALDDGTVFHGVAFGGARNAVGEVVFNTGMAGYQEILTDPSYAGQFVVLATAEVGNYGVNRADAESRGIFLSGLVVGDLTEPSNWRSETSLRRYLEENAIPGIYGVNTRLLTLHIREHGNRKAFLVVEEGSVDEAGAIERARRWQGIDGCDLAAKVSCKTAYSIALAEGPHVVCLDFGVKANILRSLASWARVTVVPANTGADEILAMRPDGIFLSNGPGDPAAVTYAIDAIRKLLSARPAIPMMGICLGHQLLSLASGAKTARLKFGHHGVNHPVKNLATGKVEITSQNHNYAVVASSLPPELEATHLNLNDGTIEGVRHKTLPVFSVQYHPEACPGPHDSQYLFAEFRALVAARKRKKDFQ